MTVNKINTVGQNKYSVFNQISLSNSYPGYKADWF